MVLKLGANAEAVVFSNIRQDVEQIIQVICKKLFGGKEYNPTAIATWISQANESFITNLIKNNGNFKYLLTTQVMQKKPAGGEGILDINANCYWNQSTDGQALVKWENEHFHVFVSVYGLAL